MATSARSFDRKTKYSDLLACLTTAESGVTPIQVNALTQLKGQGQERQGRLQDEKERDSPKQKMRNLKRTHQWCLITVAGKDTTNVIADMLETRTKVTTTRT